VSNLHWLINFLDCGLSISVLFPRSSLIFFVTGGLKFRYDRTLCWIGLYHPVSRIRFWFEFLIISFFFMFIRRKYKILECLCSLFSLCFRFNLHLFAFDSRKLSIFLFFVNYSSNYLFRSSITLIYMIFRVCIFEGPKYKSCSKEIVINYLVYYVDRCKTKSHYMFIKTNILHKMVIRRSNIFYKVYKTFFTNCLWNLFKPKEITVLINQKYFISLCCQGSPLFFASKLFKFLFVLRF